MRQNERDMECVHACALVVTNRARETTRHKQTQMKRDNEKNKSAGDCGSRNLTWPPQKVKKTSSDISLRENTVCQTEAVLWALVFLGVCLVGWGLCQLLLRCSFPSDSYLQQHTHGCWTVLQLMKLNSPALVFKWKCMVRLHCQMCIRCLKVTISGFLWNAYFIIQLDHFQVHVRILFCKKLLKNLFSVSFSLVWWKKDHGLCCIWGRPADAAFTCHVSFILFYFGQEPENWP